MHSADVVYSLPREFFQFAFPLERFLRAGAGGLDHLGLMFVLKSRWSCEKGGFVNVNANATSECGLWMIVQLVGSICDCGPWALGCWPGPLLFLIQNNNVCLIHALQCCTKLVSDVLLSISVSVLILDV